ncbi:MAG: hydroxymethylbilane synthase [Chloroflexota bacterium]
MMLAFATRPSQLARRQTQAVMAALQAAWPGLECQEVPIVTQGDRVLDRPLPEIGGKGLFTQELEAELLSGRVQVAVHSLKDLPVDDPAGAPSRLAIGAVPARADVRDVLISAAGHTLETLPPGARLGTSSPRRAAQLLAARPDVRIESLRGNVDTRLRKAHQGLYDAIVLAGAGLLRLGLEAQVAQWLPLELMLPAPGQAALAVQCRADDLETLGYLAAIDDPAARRATQAERAFLAGLGGGCSLPVAAYAGINGENIDLQGLVSSADGRRQVRCRVSGADPLAVGLACARQALEQGAAGLLGHSS